MRHLFRGIRSSIALFRTAPLAVCAAVIALTMGIGFSTTMFGIVSGATRSLPVDAPETIVGVTKAVQGADAGETAVRGLDLVRWREHAGSSATLEAFMTHSFNIGRAGVGEAQPERISGVYVTPRTFDVLGVRASMGRILDDRDGSSGAPAVAIVSDRLWATRFGRAADVVNQVILLDGVPHVVVGVMPAGFGFPIRSDIWIPLSTSPEDPRTMQVWGRLQNVTAAGLQDSLTSAQGVLAAERPETHARIGIRVIPFTELETPREVIAGLYVLLFAVSGVLVIACVNVANLFLARAAARARDTAIRLALGAHRTALLLEQMGEALVLTAIGCALGLLSSQAAIAIFASNTSHIIEAYWVSFSVDIRVVVWASSLALCAAALSAVLPAWRASRTDVIQTMRDGAGATSYRAGRTSRVLVTAQVAFACGLLALTMLLGRSALSLQQRDWPFDADAVWSTSVSVPLARMADAAERNRLVAQLARELDNLPGVRGALTTALPGMGSGSWSFALDSSVTAPQYVGTTSFTQVTPGYFDLLGATALRGRLLSGDDHAGAPVVAVVNESFVRRYSAERDPIGRRVIVGTREMTIVGVVRDLMPNDIQELHQDGVYAAMAQTRPFGLRLLATGAVTPRDLRDLVARVDPTLPIFETFTVKAAAMRDKQVLTVLSGLFGLFGAGALVMTAIGLYSVMALLVATRRREFGIRLALGANRRDLLALVTRQGIRHIVAGLVIGVALGMALTAVFSNAVEAVAVNPAGIMAGVVIALGATTLAAMAVPAWVATRINPITALKSE